MEGSLTRIGKLAPGGHELRREVVLHHQRRRILDAQGITVDVTVMSQG